MSDQAFELFQKVVLEDDANELGKLFERYPELQLRIDEPAFYFDAPAIVAVAGKGNRRLIEVLLRAGADINARSHWWAGGFGVLDSAPHELADYLIEQGAKVDIHAASRLGLFEKLQQLVATNPDLVHARGGDGKTPLHFAATVEIAAYLLDHGANIDVPDIDHESTAAQYLVRDHPDVTRYLVKRGCKTDILLAAAIGDAGLVRKHLANHPECIRTRVDHEFFPKQDPHSGGTIYMWTLGKFKSAHQIAREFDRQEVFEFLMGPDASPPSVRLINACWLGDDAVAQALLATHPGLVQALSPGDRHQVTDAAEMNNTKAVGLMLKCGWPVDGEGTTPLHFAAWHGNAELVRVILAFHPDLEKAEPTYHASPLGWAIHGSENGWHRETGDYGAVVAALLEAGAKAPTEIQGSPAVRTALLTANRRRQPL